MNEEEDHVPEGLLAVSDVKLDVVAFVQGKYQPAVSLPTSVKDRELKLVPHSSGTSCTASAITYPSVSSFEMTISACAANSNVPMLTETLSSLGGIR